MAGRCLNKKNDTSFSGRKRRIGYGKNKNLRAEKPG